MEFVIGLYAAPHEVCGEHAHQQEDMMQIVRDATLNIVVCSEHTCTRVARPEETEIFHWSASSTGCSMEVASVQASN